MYILTDECKICISSQFCHLFLFGIFCLPKLLSNTNFNQQPFVFLSNFSSGSLSLAEKKVSHYLATGSLGRPINLDSSYPDGSEGGGGTSGGGYHEHRSSTSSSSHPRKERGRDYNNQHHHSTSSSSVAHKGGEQGREHVRDYASHYPERENKSQTSTSSANNGKQTSTSSSKEVSAQVGRWFKD